MSVGIVHSQMYINLGIKFLGSLDFTDFLFHRVLCLVLRLKVARGKVTFMIADVRYKFLVFIFSLFFTLIYKSLVVTCNYFFVMMSQYKVFSEGLNLI